MSICTHGLFLLHASREQEKEREDGARVTHTRMHARTQAYTGERYLVELRGGEEED